MDFLLECIGFPPEQDFEELVALARERGEADAWRGPRGEHLRLPLGGGLELRIDRDGDALPWTLYPHLRTEDRMRLAIDAVRALPDSPADALVTGWGDPPVEGAPSSSMSSFPLSAVLTDARRLPRNLVRGHVIAVALAGFALDVEHLGASPRSEQVQTRRLAGGGWIAPLGGIEQPGGCVELCLRIANVHALTNPLTQAEVQLLEVELPARTLMLLTSPWQLAGERLPAPRAGAWIGGTFLLTGRIAGGLPSSTERVGRSFG
jgi:hypothetical protein